MFFVLYSPECEYSYTILTEEIVLIWNLQEGAGAEGETVYEP